MKQHDRIVWAYAVAYVVAMPLLIYADGQAQPRGRLVFAETGQPVTPSSPDESAALNAQFKPGTTVQLEPRAYGLGQPLDGTAANVTLRGVPGLTKLVKLDQPRDDGILSLRYAYRGWTFEGITFDGQARQWTTAGTPHYRSLSLSGARGVRFHRCAFRDLVAGVQLRDVRDVAFDDCDFYGTTPGVFAAGFQDPAAVKDASFSSGPVLGENVHDVTISQCRFHFCESGIAVNTQTTQPASNLRVLDCDFRGDWWDNPSPVLRFQASKLVTAAGTAPRITVARNGLVFDTGEPVVPGPFKGLPAGQVVSFRRDRATGAAFTRIFTGQVGIAGDAFSRAAVGDVIETADGKRGRIGSLESVSSVWVEGWESSDTYEPCDPPALATPWRLSRYYACGIASVQSDTELSLYFEPVAPILGERALTDAKLDLTRLPARVLAQTVYSGLNGGSVRGVLVSGCTFRGSWADQCSLFDLPEGARVVGNRFHYGQDEAITLTRCPGSIVSDNVFVNAGTSAVFFGGSDGSVFQGNTVRNWGVVNYNPGAVDCYATRGLVVEGNVFTATPKALNWCRYDASYREGDCSGGIQAGNVTGGTVASLNVDAKAAPKLGAVVARDARGVVGAGKGNVLVK